MKIIERIQSMSKIALTVEEEAKVLMFIETFEKQCSKLLPNVASNNIKPSVSDNILYDVDNEKIKNGDCRPIPSWFVTRCKIKN